MSPEQFLQQRIDPASDVYSLGATFFTILTGRSPFSHAQGQMAIAKAHFQEPPRRVETLVADIPQAVSAIIARCLEKPPEKRYGDASELLEALETLTAP